MNTKTSIDQVKNMGNVVQFDEGENTSFWVSYRKDRSSSRDSMRMASSPDGRTWTVSQLEGIGITPRSDNNPQLVVAGQEMFMFWVDDDRNKLLATKRAPDPNKPTDFTWFHYVQCLSTSEEIIKEPSSGGRRDAVMGAILVGDNILVSVLRKDTIEYFLFPTDPAAYDAANKKLIAVKENSVTVKDVNKLLTGASIDRFRKRNAITFFSLDPENTILVQALDVKDSKGDDRIVILQVRLELFEQGYGLPLLPLSGEAILWEHSDDNTMVLTRDPGGRVVATFRDRSNNALRSLMNSRSFPGTFEKAENLYDLKVSQNPSIFYSLGSESTTSFEGKSVQQRKVTEWVLLTDEKERVFTQDSPYGKAQRIFKIEQLNLTEESDSRTVFVHGYIDGPPPVFEGMENPFSVVNYAVTSARENSFEVVSNVIVGVKSEGTTATELGTPGPAWDVSLKMGAASSFKVTDIKSIDENTIFQLEKDRDGNFVQKGLIRSSEILMTRDAFWYIPEGEIAPACNAPEFSQIYLEILPDGKAEFELGTVTVGDLESYTASAWNDRMRPLYPDVTNYIDEIVAPRAVFFRNGIPTLRDTWTPGSPVDGTFQSTSTTYSSASLTLEESVFAGVTGKFMGAEASIMAGFEESLSTTTASIDSDGFGLSMTIDGNTGGPVARYRASAYLLTSSNDWIKELLHFQSGQENNYTIEPNSSCWKIMYVVDQILYNDSIDELNLSPEVSKSLEAQRIFTTQDLLKHLNMEYPNELRGNVDWITDPEELLLLDALRKWDVERNLYTDSYE